ncbi:Late embryoproteinsis abundant hydroxyproline-rich glycoprotein family, putative isoform 1 [Hibiscus syriacus]|uniref:Late embryoproteinsis abundant hydroxyproline-rich glycoprotein family, putative isoform 1 n=1 Tax=Hibiscus syriacus TaxID=106335 RepID=A0A6A2Z1Q8_HIBSY|nr:Late embryoproteinsis abundant hydroxyproline-rich glycoprotein family, putative isoform 1 [Hibiscus syriacus]
MAIPTQLKLSFFLLLSISTVALADEEDCVYSLYIRTGSIIKGGTDSIISLKLQDGQGEFIEINNLETGAGHGWYCNYMEVTVAGVHSPCSQQQFTVEQWLALDTSPYNLTAIRNNCPSEFPVDV